MNDKFETLFRMNLIKSVGTAPAEKIMTPVTLYSYTKGGILLALISKTHNLQEVISITKSDAVINESEPETGFLRIFQWVYEVFLRSHLRRIKIPRLVRFSILVYSNNLKLGVFFLFFSQSHLFYISL